MNADRNTQSLVRQIEAMQHGTFRWDGSRDCVGFVARCVKAQTGIDVRTGLSWKNQREARRVLDGEGGLEAATDRRFERIPMALAKRGDIAGLPDPHLGIRLMIVEGATLVGPDTHGAARRKRSEMIIAWDAGSARIPENMRDG